jgi:hypothetical protein
MENGTAWHSFSKVSVEKFLGTTFSNEVSICETLLNFGHLNVCTKQAVSTTFIESINLSPGVMIIDAPLIVAG